MGLFDIAGLKDPTSVLSQMVLFGKKGLLGPFSLKGPWDRTSRWGSTGWFGAHLTPHPQLKTINTCYLKAPV